MSESDLPQVTQRLVRCEEQLLHQQRLIDELNSVVLSQQSEIAQITQRLAAFRTLVEDLSDRGDDLPHEKPPHY